MTEIVKKRCAVYTRKSVDEGLEQDFNSLDAQREAGEAFILSQKANGWICLPDRYDDGGFSGGNTNRPALKRLLADCEAGKIDMIVVYKIDRLSRSICDFADLTKKFDEWGVEFSSVPQEINTATSAGRMMLNILITFALQSFRTYTSSQYQHYDSDRCYVQCQWRELRIRQDDYRKPHHCIMVRKMDLQKE